MRIRMKNREMKIYNLKDPQQYEDEKKFWRSQTFEYKISVLENLRKAWVKFSAENILDSSGENGNSLNRR
jgi:hypothetical protein